MGGIAITLSVGMSMTTIILLSQTAKSFLSFWSMASPLGLSHGDKDACRNMVVLAASNSTISLVSSRLTYILPVPSGWHSSGFPPSGKVLMTSLVLGSMAVESFDLPLNVNMCFVTGS